MAEWLTYLALGAFAGMARVMLGMAQGAPEGNGPAEGVGSRALSWAPSAVLLAAVVALGLCLPEFLRAAVNGAAGLLGGTLP